MKGLLWKNSLLKTLFGCVFLPLLLAFLLLPVFSSPVSAWSFGTPGSASILDSIINNPGSYATKHDATGTGTTRVDSASMSGRIRINYSPGGSGNEGYVQDLSVKTGLNIPANSIGRINFIIEGNGDTIIDVNPFNLQGDDILQQNCDVLASKRDSNNLEKPTKLYCSVLIYKITRGTTITFSSNLFGFTNSGFKIFLPTNYNWIEITDDSGGSGSVDVAQIKTDVQSILAQAQNSNLLLNDIKTLLNQVKTQGQAQQQTVEDAMENAFEAQREQLDDEASDYQQGLQSNSDQQAIDNKMTSIMSIITNFVTAITHPVISTCILPMDFRNYTGAGFYEVDLCHLSPPSGITNVLNVIFIFFVLGLAYSAIRSVIQMYKEVIDG